LGWGGGGCHSNQGDAIDKQLGIRGNTEKERRITPLVPAATVQNVKTQRGHVTLGYGTYADYNDRSGGFT